jgi:quercetin dioxygenase-like cupin family protein
MDLGRIPFTATDWTSIQPIEHKGDAGTSFWRTLDFGNVRVRLVEYSPGFRSDHWCPRGHIFLVLEGEFTALLKDGRSFRLGRGMSFQAGDDEANPHLGSSEAGARAFIVD